MVANFRLGRLRYVPSTTSATHKARQVPWEQTLPLPLGYGSSCSLLWSSARDCMINSMDQYSASCLPVYSFSIKTEGLSVVSPFAHKGISW
jgi:hypothetical protein